MLRAYTDLRDFLDGYTNERGEIQGDPATIAGEAVAAGLLDKDVNYRIQMEDEEPLAHCHSHKRDEDACESCGGHVYEISIRGQWHKTTAWIFRSWTGKRRIDGVNYGGPVYVLGTEEVHNARA